MTKVSQRLDPLLVGCRQNREHWSLEARTVRKRMNEKKVENINKDKYEGKEKNQKEDKGKSMKERVDEEKLEERDKVMIDITNVSFIPPEACLVQSGDAGISFSKDGPSLNQGDLLQKDVVIDLSIQNTSESTEVDCIALNEGIISLRLKDSHLDILQADNWINKEGGSSCHPGQETVQLCTREEPRDSQKSSRKQRGFFCRGSSKDPDEDKSRTS